MGKPTSVHVVVPWHNEEQFEQFCEAWQVLNVGCVTFCDETTIATFAPQRDTTKAGCAATKNAGIMRAIAAGADVVVVLDDDCFPTDTRNSRLASLVLGHLAALKPQPVPMFRTVTKPASRGTPFKPENRCMTMPVAASMGFWVGVGDYDAPSQLVYGPEHPMKFKTRPVFGQYFPLCGMNLAFTATWWPWCKFIDVPRYDDIWQGWLWQKKAYSMGYCFNLGGPLVRHASQSNVWANLKDEAQNAERNETLWREIAEARSHEYEELKREVGLDG